MKAADFRRIALTFAGAEESSHMGAADFRVDGRIFATLASEKHGYGNLMLTPDQQAEFLEELPDIFLPFYRVGDARDRCADRTADLGANRGSVAGDAALHQPLCICRRRWTLAPRNAA